MSERITMSSVTASTAAEKQERKDIARERKESGKVLTIQRKEIRSRYSRMGGRI
jgi:hypothetical protein